MRSISNNGRTYRYFTGEALYPFGYGLSYSKFEIGKVSLNKKNLCGSDSLLLSVDIKNTGKVDGEEVVQLYVKGMVDKGAIKSLKGFERVQLKAGKKKTIVFTINGDTLSEFKDGEGFQVAKGEHTILIGTSSADPAMQSVTVVVE
jgi:beta-glucosidase